MPLFSKCNPDLNHDDFYYEGRIGLLDIEAAVYDTDIDHEMNNFKLRQIPQIEETSEPSKPKEIFLRLLSPRLIITINPPGTVTLSRTVSTISLLKLLKRTRVF